MRVLIATCLLVIAACTPRPWVGPVVPAQPEHWPAWEVCYMQPDGSEFRLHRDTVIAPDIPHAIDDVIEMHPGLTRRLIIEVRWFESNVVKEAVR